MTVDSNAFCKDMFKSLQNSIHSFSPNTPITTIMQEFIKTIQSVYAHHIQHINFVDTSQSSSSPSLHQEVNHVASLIMKNILEENRKYLLNIYNYIDTILRQNQNIDHSIIDNINEINIQTLLKILHHYHDQIKHLILTSKDPLCS